MYFIGSPPAAGADARRRSLSTTNGSHVNRPGSAGIRGVRHNGPMTPRRPNPSTLSVVIALGTVYVLWGSTYLAIAYVVETLPPFLAAGARFLLAGGVLVACLLAQHQWRRERGRPTELPAPRLVEWRTALVVGGLLLLGGNGIVMTARQRIRSGTPAGLL